MTGLVGFLCEWGQKSWTDEDPGRCYKRAVGVVAVKDGGGVLAIKVCKDHRLTLLDETDPL